MNTAVSDDEAEEEKIIAAAMERARDPVRGREYAEHERKFFAELDRRIEAGDIDPAQFKEPFPWE